MTYDPHIFSNFLVSEGVIGFYDLPLTLKTGKQTHWYVRGRSLSQTVQRLSKTVDYVFSFIDS